MSRLIIHIGTHKTGTTSIQKTMFASRTRLRERGICYPDYSSIGHRNHYAHIGVANALASGHPTITKEMAEKFFREQKVRGEANGVTIISAEPLYRHVMAESGVPTRNPAAKVYWPGRFRFIEYLRSLSGPAEIAIVLRRQCDFAESMYQEHVKVTRYSENFERFIRDYWYHFAYLEQVEAWHKYFDKVHIINLSDIAGNEITRKFLRRLSLKPGRLNESDLANVGVEKDSIIFKRLLNGSSIAREKLDAVMKLLQDSTTRSETKEARSFFRDAEHRRSFQSRFAEGNSRLAKLAGVEAGSFFEPLGKDGGETITYGDDIDPSRYQDLIADVLSALLDRQGVKATDSPA